MHLHDVDPLPAPDKLHALRLAGWSLRSWVIELLVVPLALTLVACQDGKSDVVLAQLSVGCCSVPCFPGGMLGHTCSLERLEADLDDVASEKSLRLKDIRCQVTQEQCNQFCESPPGQRLVCRGNVLR